MALAVLIAALCLAQASDVAASHFREETKSCDPECSKIGNCNGETGQCDCPFGLTGPTCREQLFPACHSSLEPGTTPNYGSWYPKNCLCFKQLRAHPYSCPAYLRAEGSYGSQMLQPCFYDALMRGGLLCYKYADRPEEKQLSDSPGIDDPGVEWYRINSYPEYKEIRVEGEQVPKEVKTPDGGTWRPLRECPGNCSHRGWCQIQGSNYQGRHDDPQERWCSCHSFSQGVTCEIAEPYHCYNNCSGRGECARGGWCHCQPGYWGHGCTRSKAYVSDKGWRPNHADIKIYVYDLPEIVVHRREFDDQWALIDRMYNVEIEFMEHLLADWGVRTENPWEAALFVVPSFTYWYTGNIGNPYYLMQHVTHHLQQLPFFNLTGGRNHVLMATNDRGVCKLGQAQLELQHSIKLVHFGQAPRRPYARHKNPEAGHHLTGNLPQPGHRFEGFPDFNGGDVMEEAEICYRPEKDVVTPNYLHTAWVQPDTYSRVWKVEELPDGNRKVTRRTDAEPRETTLFFAGYVKPDMVYSQGVRQTLHRMFKKGGKHDPEGPNKRPDYKVSEPVYNAVDQMIHSKFCLAPMGAGWGIRLAEAMVTGCVPVIVQDHVYQALWDVLPYEEFSIRISRAELHDLVNILDDVTPEQLKKLQAGVDKWHRAFYWDKEWGGLAYNYTITALKRRALRMWSQDFRHHHLHLR
ncbi:hypothetical protein HYH03_016057 [Edaphochlamys debaryana]|uniref:EGF-like domain-containing protein n=1 Tax=Edaphochlamys debaryana TaxID=47281 RepID=A0A835XKZ6_9CHLO|nr:hypothetical protein HYH03_016057 [Edaphochlamys debaryana]|eukprot:KAG2485167.1 hypothetical protein HYH03_016057 [Edaphochlamys debaryana]